MTLISAIRSGMPAAQVFEMLRENIPSGYNATQFLSNMQHYVDVTCVGVIDDMFSEASDIQKNIAFKALWPLMHSVEPQVSKNFLAHTLESCVSDTMEAPELSDYLLITELTILSMFGPGSDSSLLREFTDSKNLVDTNRMKEFLE